MFWIIITFVIAIIAYRGENERKVSRKQKLVCRATIVLIFSFISAFGSPSSQDHQWYALLYYDIVNSPMSDFSFYWGKQNGVYEIGYMFLNYIGRFLGLGNASFFFLIAFIVNVSIVNFVYNYKNAAIIICLTFLGGFVQQGNLVRQILASAVFLNSIRYLIKGELVRYILCVLLTMCFHFSAFILFLLAPLCLIKTPTSKKRLNVFLWISWIVSLLISLKLFDISNVSIISFLSSYESYMTTKNSIGMEYSIYRVLFFNAFTFLFMSSSYKKDFILLSIFIYYVIMMNVSLQIPNVARLAVYFGTVTWVCLFDILSQNVSNKSILGELSKISKYVIPIILISMAFSQFVFSNEAVFFSESYSLSDLYTITTK